MNVPPANSFVAAATGVELFGRCAPALFPWVAAACKVNSDTTKFPLLYSPGPSPGSAEFLMVSRNMPVIGNFELTNAVMVYVSVPIEFWLVLANNSPADNKENVVPLREDAL